MKKLRLLIDGKEVKCVEPIVNCSIGNLTRDSFGIVKEVENNDQNPCDLCKYVPKIDSISDECRWCLTVNSEAQYYI